MALVPLNELQVMLDRSSVTLHSWRKKGCPGFKVIDGRVYGDFQTIQSWQQQTRASKPGRKGKVQSQMSRKYLMNRSKGSGDNLRGALMQQLKDLRSLGAINGDQVLDMMDEYDQQCSEHHDRSRAFKNTSDKIGRYDRDWETIH